MKPVVGSMLLIFLSLCGRVTQGQDSIVVQQSAGVDSAAFWTINKNRLRWVTIGHIGTYTGSLTGLSIMWYSRQPQSPFHFHNDNAEWMQVDKAGHFYSAYQISRASHALWQYAGVPQKKSVWIAGWSGLAFLSIIEVLDGFSSEYGFSWSDYTTNILGSTAFISQEIGWGGQRLIPKFSVHTQRYPAPELQRRADELYGKSFQERILKDYNHQTYWLSADFHSLFKIEKWPGWLNIAAGYGAGGMYGGKKNIAYDNDGNIIFDGRYIPRYRQWYLSPDINFSRIRSNKKWIKTVFFMLDALKLPAPALEFSYGKLRGHFIYF